MVHNATTRQLNKLTSQQMYKSTNVQINAGESDAGLLVRVFACVFACSQLGMGNEFRLVLLPFAFPGFKVFDPVNSYE